MPIDYNHPNRKTQTPKGTPRRIVLRGRESVNLSQLTREAQAEAQREGKR